MQWFHRNPLKASSKLDLDLGLIIKTPEARKLASDASMRREKLLSVMCNPDTDFEIFKDSLQNYIGSFYGYIFQYSEDGSKNDSKIRFTRHVRWSNSIDLKSDDIETHADFMFEWASMLMNVAFWFSKKAAKVSSTDNIRDEDAKLVHKCLKYAAGLIQHCKELYPRLHIQLPKESDGDPNIMDAYIYQFKAEAQEVVVAQAIERNYTESLIAYAYYVLVLLKDNKGGKAIACANKANQTFQQALDAAKLYQKSNGVGLTLKPAQHQFFLNLENIIERNMRRAKDENTLIYHEKVPDSIEDLKLKAEYGLANPELPPVQFDWAPEWKTVSEGFDSSYALQNLINEQNKAKATKTKTSAEAPLEELKEVPIYSTDKVPSNQSGCLIS